MKMFHKDNIIGGVVTNVGVYDRRITSMTIKGENGNCYDLDIVRGGMICNEVK